MQVKVTQKVESAFIRFVEIMKSWDSVALVKVSRVTDLQVIGLRILTEHQSCKLPPRKTTLKENS